MRRSDMAASMEHHEPPMRDIDLDEDARIHRARELEERERERYHHLPVHHLEKEKELREVVLPPTPSAHRHVTNGAEHREHAVDVKQHTQGQPATLTVTEQHIVHQQTTHPEPTKTKSKKRVGFGAFPGFGRKGGHVTDAGEGREVHHTETVYEKNGASSAHAYGGQGHLEAYDSPTTLTVYAGYLKRVPGLLRIVQLLVGVIVCAAVNAERCLSNSITTIVCASASSPLWYGVLGGQGYVLFVAIIFILGNFALIFYHICTRPKPATTSRTLFSDKFRLGEIGYDALAVVFYVIAAIVESWYASWQTLPVNWPVISGIPSQNVRNVYRPQWIAAAVFAWLNVVLYAIDIVYKLLFSKR